MDEIAFYCTICGESLAALPECSGGFCNCPRCERVIPIPGYPARPGQSADLGAVFPADILTIEIKFLTVCCGNKVRVDARYQGATLDCPVCCASVKVPDWEGTRPTAPLGHGINRAGNPLVRLSPEECEFLSAPMKDSREGLLPAGHR